MSSSQHFSIHNPPMQCGKLGYEDEIVHTTFEWNGITDQNLLVEGLVVGIGETALRVAVTHIHEDTWRSDDFYREVSSYAWFQQIGNSYYRDLLGLSKARTAKRDLGRVERLSQEYPLTDPSVEIAAGDTVHVHRTVFWGSDGTPGQRGIPVYDVCKLPVPNIGVEAGLQKLSDRTLRLAKQLVRSAQNREHIDMLTNPRVQPNEAFRPFEDSKAEGTHKVVSRRVFGHGQVKDHFVDVKAKEQYVRNWELQGDIRFTEEGDVTLVPNIMPFGEGSEDDPLMEVSIEIHSTTVLNRAVGEQQAYVLVDGVKYTAFVDPEVSSHHFENPGHEVVFGGFRADDETLDCFWLTKEQKEAYFRKRERERELTTSVIDEAIDAGKQLTGKDGVVTGEEIDRRRKEVDSLASEDARIIESIKNNTLDGAMSTGAPLMVPRSMLDSIEVILPAVDD